MTRKTTVHIENDAFYINGQPTYPGRRYKDMKIEGLLMNSRMVQGIFDDLNPETRPNWNYPDGSPFDAERNTREFIENMPLWLSHGMIAFDINLQGGSPRGYSIQTQPWINSTFRPDGSMRPEYLTRLEKILDRADELGMVVMLGFFYFGQEPKLESEAATIRACDNATQWLIEKQYTNVLVEIANECNIKYTRPIILPDRAHELIERVKKQTEGKFKTPSGRLLVSTSFGGGYVPTDNVVAASDYVLLHGNTLDKPEMVLDICDRTRAQPSYRGQPLVYNEDDHFDFDKPFNNMLAAISKYAGWGLFDYRMKDEGFEQGYQSVPTDWGINSERKRGFFRLLKEVTGV
jgi:hypothetical protein